MPAILLLALVMLAVVAFAIAWLITMDCESDARPRIKFLPSASFIPMVLR